MSLVALSTIGGFLALIMIILIFLVFGLLFADSLQGMLLLISISLVIILHQLTTSSAAPPACLDGFTVETNGGTDGVDTCTSLHH